MLSALLYPQDVVLAMEEAECKYWKDFYTNVSEKRTEELGLKILETACGATCFSMKAHDILAFNRVLMLGVKGGTHETTLREIKEFYRSENIPRFFVALCPYPGREESALLDRLGFVRYNNWAKTGMHLYQSLTDYSTGVDIVEATRDDADLVGDVLLNAFEFPVSMKEMFTGTLARENWHTYIAYVDNEPAGVASLHIHRSIGSLSIAGTLPGFRQKQVQKSLIRHRVWKAFEAGCSYIKAETAENTEIKPSISYQNMIKCGLQHLYLRPNYLFEFN